VNELIGRKVQKQFAVGNRGKRAWFNGVVTRWYDGKAPLWTIKYEDSDEEDLEWHELQPILVDASPCASPAKTQQYPPLRRDLADVVADGIQARGYALLRANQVCIEEGLQGALREQAGTLDEELFDAAHAWEDLATQPCVRNCKTRGCGHGGDRKIKVLQGEPSTLVHDLSKMVQVALEKAHADDGCGPCPPASKATWIKARPGCVAQDAHCDSLVDAGKCPSRSHLLGQMP
jgi:hypothetical protein